MSDDRVRTLERRWKETGAVEDEAAYLSERVRGGDLRPEQLELAAFLDYPAAVHATGQGPGSESPLREWARTASKDPISATYTAASAILWAWDETERDRTLLRDESRGPEWIGELENLLFGKLWTLLGDWAQSPTTQIATELASLEPQLREQRNRSGSLHDGEWWPEVHGEASMEAHERLKQLWLLPDLLCCVPSEPALAENVVSVLSAVATEQALLAGIRHALLPWALGSNDPIREKLEPQR